MTATLLSALFSHWWRNPVQIFTLLAGLALGTALWSGVQAINAEARASYDAAAQTLGEGQLAQMATASGVPMSDQTYVALRRAGWLVSPVIEGRLGPVQLVGIDPLTVPRGTGAARVTDGADLTGFLAGRGQIFGRAETLAR
ncbi:MAG: ABC transporter permease, partial [Paracoccaceae bacterium]